MDSMTEATLDAMKASADFKTDFKAAELVTFEKPEPVVRPEPARVDSYQEATAHAMQRAFTAKAAIDAEARESLAAQRASGPKTLTHNEEAKQKGDAFRRSMNGYLGHIREAEIARGVPEREATSLLAEPVPPKDEPAFDNSSGPGPTIVVEDNQVAMHKLFTIGGQRVLGSSKGICLEPPA